MDPINKNTYTDVRSRIKSQIYNRILKKPNPESYEMVSSVSGTSKSLGGGISLPERIKDLLGYGDHNNSSTKANGPVRHSDNSSESERESTREITKEISSNSQEKESEANGKEGNKVSLLSTSRSTGSQVRPEGPESSGGAGGGAGEEKTFISLSTLARFIGVDRKKLQRAILQYSMVYGEGLYNVESNSYQIPLKAASVLVLGKRMVERGESRSYREAFRTINDKPNEGIKREIKQIEESIKSYVMESRTETEDRGDGTPREEREDEKEALGVVGAIAEALIEASSSITNRINEIENSILDFHYTFLKIKQEVESVREELERIEKMVTEYLLRK